MLHTEVDVKEQRLAMPSDSLRRCLTLLVSMCRLLLHCSKMASHSIHLLFHGSLHTLMLLLLLSVCLCCSLGAQPVPQPLLLVPSALMAAPC
jgi:hypothetical protein